ncbi:MAG TPA: hypothetical protein VGU02_14610 [Gaiellaceae bacterium]|nr:hypothetical protein [Gaiellaceae bacterium]
MTEPFDVYVNGVARRRGTDYEVRGSTLYLVDELRGEGRLGFWRWASLWLGVAGTYRRNDKVDVVKNGRVFTLTPAPAGPAPGQPAR